MGSVRENFLEDSGVEGFIFKKKKNKKSLSTTLWTSGI